MDRGKPVEVAQASARYNSARGTGDDNLGASQPGLLFTELGRGSQGFIRKGAHLWVAGGCGQISQG